MIQAFLSWVYQILLAVLNGRKPLKDLVLKQGKRDEVEQHIEPTAREIAPTRLVVDTSPIVFPLPVPIPISPASSPKKTVTFALDVRSSPRSSPRSPTRYADSASTETPFGTTPNTTDGKQRLSFHWRGGNCHEKVKMMKQKPQRSRRGSMHLLGCNKESDKGIISSTDNSLQVLIVNMSCQYNCLTHLTDIPYYTFVSSFNTPPSNTPLTSCHTLAPLPSPLTPCHPFIWSVPIDSFDTPINSPLS